ncbi:enolase 4 isoform X3 [Xyrauchen texanus]|uniref:enolase 4 isoform X3 n=1 Tax=Xyrauchen texanus TaxID=154827 RepID=UPI002241B083|nr:enolase 4 isoform X3 [Xyrauchen texanus]XP_052002027.1 enolase 4 isoform X3 [Xyrauchen texanus]
MTMSYKGFLSCHSRESKEDKEFYDLKNKAAEYYRSNGVPQRIEDALNEMFFQKPDDIYGYLANYFSRFSYTPVISRITGKEVFDGRGLPAVQIDVHCIIRNEEKMVCSAVMGGPYDGLTGGVAESGETISNSDQLKLCVTTALKWIREHIGPMLQGISPKEQTNIDKLLSDFLMARYLEDKDSRNSEEEEEEEEEEEKNKNKTETVSDPPPQATPPSASTKDKKGSDKGKKGNGTEKPLPPAEPPVPRLTGAMAVGVVSLAVAKTAARLGGLPLYKHIQSVRDQQAQNEIHLPVSMITILSCGKTSAGKLNLLEEVILLPSSPQRARQVIGMGLELQCEMRRVLNGLACKAGPILILEDGALQVGFERPEQALDLVTEACANLELPLGSELRLAVNCAAHCLMDYSRGKYEVMSGCHKSPDELVDMYEGLINKYPAILALIDPFRKEDVEQWEKLASVIGQSCRLIADASSNPCSCWSEAKPLPPGVTKAIIRHHSDMTICDLTQSIAEQRGIRAGCILPQTGRVERRRANGQI